MKNPLLISLASLLLLTAIACKKDKNPGPAEEPPVEYTTTDVQVVLPAGSTMGLSDLKIFTLAGTSAVSGDGKAKVPFITGGAQLAFLFDGSDNLILSSYITA